MLLVSVFALSADPLSRYLPDSSLVSLRAGAVSSVSLPSEGMLSLAPTVSSRDALAAEIRDLRPTVGVEVLQVLAGITGRTDSTRDLLALYNAAHAVSSMKGITYYSVSRGRNQVLFLQAYAISEISHPVKIADPVFTGIPRENDMFTFQEDNSFGKNTYQEHFAFRDDHLLVKMENLSTISFMLVPIIQPHNLVTQVILIPAGKDLIFYGVAYLRTGMPIGDHSGREQSLKNRLVAMASWLKSRLLAAP